MSRTRKTDRARAIHAAHQQYKSGGKSPVKQHHADVGLIATGQPKPLLFGSSGLVDNGGVRFGVNRKFEADLKVKMRRAERKKNNAISIT